MKRIKLLPPDPKVAAWREEIDRRFHQVIDTSSLTLSRWLRLMGGWSTEIGFERRQFPTERHRNNFCLIFINTQILPLAYF